MQNLKEELKNILRNEYDKKWKKKFPNTQQTVYRDNEVTWTNEFGEVKTVIQKIPEIQELDTKGEDLFQHIVELDAMSYPKNADGTYNTNAEIIGIGRVASGLLLPKYADENFLEFESDVFEATKLYANNYNQLAGQYKNLNTFKSVKDFVNFNLNNSEIEVNTIDKKVKKTPDEKLQALIDQQFPTLSLQDLKEIADLDSETEIETGKIGAFSKTVLLPVYLRATEEEKHNIKKNKAILNKICNKFDLISNGKIKRELQDAASKATCLSDLMKIFDIKVWGSESRNKSVILDRITSAGYIENRDFVVWAQTEEYDIITPLVKGVSEALDYINDPTLTKRTNDWCTGFVNNDNYWNNTRYRTPDNKRILVTFMNKLNTTNPKLNVQISLHVETGAKPDSGCMLLGDDTGYTAAEALIKRIFINNPYLLPILTNKSFPNFNNMTMKNFYLLDEVKKDLGFTNTDFMTWYDEKFDPVLNYSVDTDLSTINPMMIKEIHIQEGVQKIPRAAFMNFTEVYKITFPESLKIIGQAAFRNCVSLNKIKLPKNLEVIETGAFDGCINLKGSIKLPYTIKAIYPFAFDRHASGLSFTLPKRFFDDKKKLMLPASPESENIWWKNKNRIKIDIDRKD